MLNQTSSWVASLCEASRTESEQIFAFHINVKLDEVGQRYQLLASGYQLNCLWHSRTSVLSVNGEHGIWLFKPCNSLLTHVRSFRRSRIFGELRALSPPTIFHDFNT